VSADANEFFGNSAAGNACRADDQRYDFHARLPKFEEDSSSRSRGHVTQVAVALIADRATVLTLRESLVR
jgi:hypothetical protein